MKFTAAFALGFGFLASPALAERATKPAQVVSFEGGEVLIDANRDVVLQEISPIGEKGPVPASKRETIEIGVYTSDELAPRALVNVTNREKVTSISMTRDGSLNTGRPVSASEGAVETVDPTNIISLEAEDADKAHSFGDTVDSGDLYFARNGEVYQYIGVLDAE
jgi:hypothetical protein